MFAKRQNCHLGCTGGVRRWPAREALVHYVSGAAVHSRSYIASLDVVVVPDHEAVTGDGDAEADKSNRPRRKCPQDED